MTYKDSQLIYKLQKKKILIFIGKWLENWLSWIVDEAPESLNEEGKKRILDLFDQALGYLYLICSCCDCNLTPIICDLSKFIYIYSDFVSFELLLQKVLYLQDLLPMGLTTIQEMRDSFESAITSVGLHVAKGSQLWNAYRAFEEVERS